MPAATLIVHVVAAGRARTAHKGDSMGGDSGDRSGTNDTQRPSARDHPAKPAWAGVGLRRTPSSRIGLNAPDQHSLHSDV